MGFEPGKNLLQISEEITEMAIRKINLGKPGEMEQVVEILKKWVEEQPHFKRKDFSDNYLKMSVLSSKGSIERVKKLLDRICTFRTLMPNYFRALNLKMECKEIFDVMHTVVLPKPSKDNCRIFIMKFWGDIKKSSQLTDIHRISIMIAEYIMQTDSIFGVHICIDLTETNIFELVTKQSPIELRDVATIFMDGYGMRVKGIHCVSSSKMIDAFIAIIKPVLKPKLISRIHIYKSWDELHDVFGKDILPIECGGIEKSIKEIHADWVDELSSEQFRKYWQERSLASTNESLRIKSKFNEEYAGMPGSFRVLSVD